MFMIHFLTLGFTKMSNMSINSELTLRGHVCIAPFFDEWKDTLDELFEDYEVKRGTIEKSMLPSRDSNMKGVR